MVAGTRVVMIDNYDSFTWNLYQYLCEEGAQVEVFRNDKITVQEIRALQPDLIVISPGPGHPLTDSGISREVIAEFKGVLPIFGVCMGQQCIFSVFGGDVEFAGEIVHGKTSPINHDNKGVFLNVPQGIAVTRYHSLAGTQGSLPAELEVTATTENGIIMGVRHKKYTIEAVQFHPESILTEEGHLMMRNVLNLRGGVWETSSEPANDVKKAKGSILDDIYAKRKQDVAAQSAVPGQTFADLKKLYDLGLAPNQIDFFEKLSKFAPFVISEIKRASPSKGDIDLGANAAEQAKLYSDAGAAAISVLTEPHWFKGSINDLAFVSRILSNNAARPAILRKEFIFSEYQILEARLAGADSVLLIVKMLNDDELKTLYDYSLSLGMEPLVEVSNSIEFHRAIKISPKIIGINNRDLHSFNVDLNTTTSLLSLKPEGSILIALSGITSPDDGKAFRNQGVDGFLIGEALMKSDNVKKFIGELLQ